MQTPPVTPDDMKYLRRIEPEMELACKLAAQIYATPISTFNQTGKSVQESLDIAYQIIDAARNKDQDRYCEVMQKEVKRRTGR